MQVWVDGRQVAVQEDPGRRDSMEDSFCVCDGLAAREKTAFFAVFDGHGGSELSEFVKTGLVTELAKMIEEREGDLAEEIIKD